jgi:hypothetical protein
LKQPNHKNLQVGSPLYIFLRRTAKIKIERWITHLLFIDGSHQAIDSAAIDADQKKQPKSRSEHSGNVNWGAKFGSFGNKLTWFGYKMHFSVGTERERIAYGSRSNTDTRE